ncbi:hypothetical protein ACS0TY_036153 [Phlomoides rotata]
MYETKLRNAQALRNALALWRRCSGTLECHVACRHATWRVDMQGSVSKSFDLRCFQHRFFEMGAVNSELEELFQEKKRVRNPLVPIGAFMTAGVLTAGLISFKQGNSQLGQKLMRARVVVQGATVALMVGTAYYSGEKFWKS